MAKLFLLHLATLQPIGAPVPGYLVRTEDGTNVLVDSGCPFDYIDHPPTPRPPYGIRLVMRPEDWVVNRLASIGLRPEDIDVLVCTHFDEDHAGNHDLFPKAELVVQRSHYEAARAGHPRFAGIRSHWDAPGLRYRLVDGDTVLLPGIELVESGGHVPGHQSVLVRLPETGAVLLTIDAVPAASMFDAATRIVLPFDLDEAATRASTAKLAQLAARERAALVVFGHDAEQWQTLRRAPEWYG